MTRFLKLTVIHLQRVSNMSHTPHDVTTTCWLLCPDYLLRSKVSLPAVLGHR